MYLENALLPEPAREAIMGFLTHLVNNDFAAIARYSARGSASDLIRALESMPFKPPLTFVYPPEQVWTGFVRERTIYTDSPVPNWDTVIPVWTAEYGETDMCFYVVVEQYGQEYTLELNDFR